MTRRRNGGVDRSKGKVTENHDEKIAKSSSSSSSSSSSPSSSSSSPSSSSSSSSSAAAASSSSSSSSSYYYYLSLFIIIIIYYYYYLLFFLYTSECVIHNSSQIPCHGQGYPSSLQGVLATNLLCGVNPLNRRYDMGTKI